MTLLLFVLGLVCLIVGAEVLVRGASRLAGRLGISPLVIGLTVVAFGTSSPELAVSVQSALADQGNIALGNVIGSNIFNILTVLGLSAAVIPLVVSHQLIRLDVPLMIGASLLILLLALDGTLGRLDGLLLVVSLVLYFGFLFVQSRRQNHSRSPSSSSASPGAEHPGGHWSRDIVLVLAGLGLLAAGSRWLVNSAVVFAESLGVSELVIGLTIVAAGTSLPEAVTSVIAAMRKERDIAVGNVVGSNIFNLLGVLGIASLFAPAGIAVSPAVLAFDLPIMLAVAFACLPLFYTGGVISRAEGIMLLAYYIAYSLYLILAATQHDALPRFSAAMLLFVIPITVITLVILALQDMRRRRRSASSGPQS